LSRSSRYLVRRDFGRRRLQALVDQPTSQHGGSVFLEPLVKQFTNFFPQVGRVAQAGEFVGLKSITRGGDEKFPRRLGTVFGHGDTPKLGNRQEFNVTVLPDMYQ
jgi:hypothetical protein